MHAYFRQALAFIVTALASLIAAAASTAPPQPDSRNPTDLSKFTIARVVYESDDSTGEAFYGYEGRIWARWETDYPDADSNLGKRLGQLTRIKVNPKHQLRHLTDADLGDFPFLYIEDPGWMVLTQAEKKGLAEYLRNGGFMWCDDFWGEAEWQNFADNITEILGGRQWREITPQHPIFHAVYDLNVMPQIPALPFAMRSGGLTAEPPGMHKYPAGSTEVPHLRGWFDDSGRLMVVATHNTDLGDGFEKEAFGQWYFERFSTRAYMLGVNIITYAMTH